jgi:membrane fusion protein (multidrug efflux system)
MKQVPSPWVTSLLGCLLAVSACGGKQEAAADAAGAGLEAVQEYPVLRLAPATAHLHSEYPTVLQGQANVEIRPKTDGFIDQVLVDEGARVRKGQLLFRLNSDEADQQVHSAESAILSAQADVTAAQLDVDKTRPLVEQQILSSFQLKAFQATLQAKKAALAQARAALLSARKNQSYTHITSPVDGVIGNLPYKQGSLVNSSQTEPLTTVSSIGQVRAYFSINEKEALRFGEQTENTSLKEALRKLPPVQLVLATGQVYEQAGHVETASGLISTETGSATVRATFPNPHGVLRSGATGRVRIPQDVPQALLVPQAATAELQGKRFVYVVGPGNKVKSTEITVLPLTDGQQFVVKSGLKAGDSVVLDGVNALQDGQAITPRPATSAPSTAAN